ncbi:MAG: capsular biosynthesis protein, partial [Gluconacetobacter diazotrophicus]|nr:capsular biosynthesis protein [Gluconacetobacter diazotrophicus]
MPILGKVDRSWEAIEPHRAGADAPFHPLAIALRQGRIGGAFWLDSPDPAGSAVATLLLPPDHAPVGPGRRSRADRTETLLHCWRSATRSRDAAGLLLVLPGHEPVPPPLRDAVGRDGGRIVSRSCDPHALLDRADAVLLADGASPCDLAVLALLRGLPVLRFDDTAENPARALALLCDATRYRDPFTGAATDAAATIDLLGRWRAVMERNRGVAVCTGMAWWKRRRIADLFSPARPDRPVRFRRTAAAALRLARAEGGAIATWSTRMPRNLQRRAEAAGIPLLRVEDGFIRSLGLGSGLLPPASIVVDDRGLYLDPRRPSALEHILAEHPFDDALRDRARRLSERLRAAGISKYAAGGAAPPPTGAPPGRRVVLVPGQVSDDLSVRLGAAGGPADNLSLLERVRAAEPDSWILFRPHPDVDAGHRAGAVPDDVVLRVADRVSRGGSIAALIAGVDAVHTLTSLAGFEALLRGREVHCWGQPFYAGWGLTRDHAAPIRRRTRRLTVDELVAGALILYPDYLDPLSRLPCGPETVLDRLAERALWRPTAAMRLRALQGRAMR